MAEQITVSVCTPRAQIEQLIAELHGTTPVIDFMRAMARVGLAFEVDEAGTLKLVPSNPFQERGW